MTCVWVTLQRDFAAKRLHREALRHRAAHSCSCRPSGRFPDLPAPDCAFGLAGAPW